MEQYSTNEQRKLGVLAWLMAKSSRMHDAPEGRRFYITITPDVAAIMLGHLAANQRSVKKDQVARLADDMTRGRWSRNGDCIRYSRDLHLWDGQHRLHAVIKSAITLADYPVLVCADDQAEMTFDTGIVVRSSNDLSRASGDEMDGINGVRAAAILLEHHDFNVHRVNTTSKLARREIARASEFIEPLKLLPHKVGMGYLAAFIRCARVDLGAALDWFNGALTGQPLIRGAYSPAAQLLHRFMIETRGARAGQAYTYEQAHRAISLYNSWRTGREHQIKALPKFLGGSHDLPKVR